MEKNQRRKVRHMGEGAFVYPGRVAVKQRGEGEGIRGKNIQEEGTARPVWLEQSGQVEASGRSLGPLTAVTVTLTPGNMGSTGEF